MVDVSKKKMSLKANVLTIIVGIIGIIYWLIGIVENAIGSLYENY